MTALNLQEKYKSYYAAAEQPELVDISEATYVSILGEGSPGTDIFYEKKKAILHFVAELEKYFVDTDQAFCSNIVEIFYWFDEEQTGFVDIGNFYTTVDLDLLQYRIAIRIPEYITEQIIQTAAISSQKKRFVRDFERFAYTAGSCVQILHLGPFAGELQTLPLLQQFATENGLIKSGMHHEMQKPAKLTPISRTKVTPAGRSKLTPASRSKLTPLGDCFLELE